MKLQIFREANKVYEAAKCECFCEANNTLNFKSSVISCSSVATASNFRLRS